MTSLPQEIDALASDSGFSGVVSVDHAGETELARAYGHAHRAYAVANTVGTRFGIASGTKGLTALTVVDLIERDQLSYETTARSILGDDLPLIDDAVTVEQLLAHRSGVGDHVDEDADLEITDYVLPVPVHTLAETAGYLPVLGPLEPKFAPGERFTYCNGGYVVLALIIERVSGLSFHDAVRERVIEPAGMRDTAFLRSDDLPAGTATGYLTDGPDSRTNLLHLPVRGTGDGGIYSTVADLSTFWRSLFAGRIVPAERVAEMVRPHSDVPDESMRYGLGFWLHETTDEVVLEGYDAGVSFRSVHQPQTSLTHTVIANTSDGAWPIAQHLSEHFSG